MLEVESALFLASLIFGEDMLKKCLYLQVDHMLI